MTPNSGSMSEMYLPNSPSRMASASCSLANRKGRSKTPSAGMMPTSGEDEVTTISCVPERSACVACRSPPRAPPQKSAIFILPPDFSFRQARIASTPLPTGWSWLTPFERRSVRSANSARAGRVLEMAIAAATVPISIDLNFIAVSSTGCFRYRKAILSQPCERDGHKLREEHEQEHHDRVREQERQHADDDAPHGHAGDAADHVEDDADRRGDQADAVVHDEQHAEIDRINARLADDRHQHRRHDKNGRGQV